jgi:hypothetical protein
MDLDNPVRNLPPEWSSLAIALLLAVGSLVVLRRVWRTTLAAPILWGLASLAMLAACDGILTMGYWPKEGQATFLLHYAAAVSTFCPIMALLGAKRPQSRGWQWVVLALWMTLLVPAVQATIAGVGNQWQLHAMWRVLIVGLMVLELLAYLPTRDWLACLLTVLGQVALVSPYFGGFLAEFFSHSPPGHSIHTLAIACFLSSGVLADLIYRFSSVWRPNAVIDACPLATCNKRWRAFRNGWGSFWGLRVKNRINESATLGDWPVRLEWNGFVAKDGPSPDVDDRAAAQIQQAMDSLLRRFERTN